MRRCSTNALHPKHLNSSVSLAVSCSNSDVGVICIFSTGCGARKVGIKVEVEGWMVSIVTVEEGEVTMVFAVVVGG